MCLAIAKPKNVLIPIENLENGWIANPDGAGFAVAHAGKIIVRKGFFSFRQFLRHWRLWQYHAAIIHFRFATHGYISQANCHPFRVGKAAMVHNGVLPYRSTKARSDTNCFAREVIAPLVQMGELPYMRDELAEFIGRHNKLAFLFPDGEFDFVNEKQGVWDTGAWYSNAGYMPLIRCGYYKGAKNAF